jgi:hypothetical protein
MHGERESPVALRALEDLAQCRRPWANRFGGTGSALRRRQSIPQARQRGTHFFHQPALGVRHLSLAVLQPQFLFSQFLQ